MPVSLGNDLPNEISRPLCFDATTPGIAAGLQVTPGNFVDIELDVQSLVCDRNRGDRANSPTTLPLTGIPPYLDGFIWSDQTFSVAISGNNMGWPGVWLQLYSTVNSQAIAGNQVFLFGADPTLAINKPPFRIQSGVMRVRITNTSVGLANVRYGLHIRSN